MNQNDQNELHFQHRTVSSGLHNGGYERLNEIEYEQQDQKDNRQLFEDSRVTQYIFDCHRLIETIRLQLLIVSSILLIIDYDENFQLQESQSDLLLWIIFALTIILILLTHISYYTKMKYLREALLQPFQASYFNNSLFWRGIKESIILIMIPSIFTDDIKIPFTQHKDPKKYYYSLNDFFTLCIFIRGILILIIILQQINHYSSKTNRLCSYYAADMNIGFIIRLWIHKAPIKLVVILFFSGLTFFSLGIWISERPLIRERFDEAGNIFLGSLNTTFFTIVLFSYGEYNPETQLGRLLLSTCIFYGFMTVSLFISTLMSYFQMNVKEQYSSVMLDLLEQKSQIDKVICGIAEQYYYLVRFEVNPFSKERIRIMKKLLNQFQKLSRDKKSQQPETLETIMRNKVALTKSIIQEYMEQLKFMKQQQAMINEAFDLRLLQLRFKYGQFN